MDAQCSPAFPTEIFESILSYSNHSTLLTTSSVDRTLHLITRKYLFNFVALKSTVFDDDTISRARTFLSLLDHVPDLVDCVRRIHIDCFGENLLELSGGRRIAPDTKPLIAILSRLPRLNSISLRGRDSTTSSLSQLGWNGICFKLRRAFTRTFRSPLVSEIKLSHFHSLSLSIFVGCHSLKHLSFHRISLGGSRPSHDELGFRTRLKSLSLRHSFTGKDDAADLDWLISPQGLLDISQLDKFVFFSVEKGGHIQFARVLSLCAESIKSMELKMDTSETYSVITSKSSPRPLLPPSPIDIASNLTKLTIIGKLRTVSMSSKSYSYSSPLPWLVARLEMLTPASNLSEIILQLNLLVSDTILKTIDWADLTSILSSGNLPNLNLVTIKMSSHYTPLSPAQWAVLENNQYLSRLVDKGRLVLVNSSP